MVNSQRSRMCAFPWASMIFAAVPTPAQLMTPPRGALVLAVHWTLAATAAVISERTVMSVFVNLTLGDARMSSGGGARSTIEI